MSSAAPATEAVTFLKLLGKSRLLNAEQLEILRNELQTETLPSSKEIAAKLVERSWLTGWQAQQLLMGRTNFYLKKYRLLERIAEGGHAKVYKAEQYAMRRPVAIKVPRQEMLRDPEAVRRFMREIQASSALNHQNVVSVFDADEVNGIYFLVMQFVPGCDLDRWINDRGKLEIPIACECIRQAAEGLQHIHEQGLVHRDLKPSNLLITEHDDGTVIVKILDVGVARFIKDTEGKTALTQAGQIIGTIDYMPPEQIEDVKEADIRSDIYSLGCTLYKLLTGELPFGGSTFAQKIYARINQPPPDVRDIRPDVPVALQEVIQKMMATDPDERYSEPAEVAAALIPFITGTGLGDEDLEEDAPPASSLSQAFGEALKDEMLHQQDQQLPAEDDDDESGLVAFLNQSQQETTGVGAFSTGLAHSRAHSTAYQQQKAGPNWVLVGSAIIGTAAIVAVAMFVLLSPGKTEPSLPKQVNQQPPDPKRDLDPIPKWQPADTKPPERDPTQDPSPTIPDVPQRDPPPPVGEPIPEEDIPANSKVITDTFYVDQTVAKVTRDISAGANSLSVARTTGFGAGDEILLIDLQGTKAGFYQVLKVSQVGSGELSIEPPVRESVPASRDKVLVQKIPVFENLVVQPAGIITAEPWDGEQGGIVALKVTGKAIVAGRISADGLGFRGGPGASSGYAAPGTAGESYRGLGSLGSNDAANGGPPNDGGGGAGLFFEGRGDNGAGGGGGSYRTQGTKGSGDSAGGQPGNTYGNQELTELFLGSGGGGAGFDTDKSGSPPKDRSAQGGRGGGILFLSAGELELKGTLSAAGEDGEDDPTGAGNESGGGGGGSGGSVVLELEQQLDLSASQVVPGGRGGSGESSELNGGSGGEGRLVIRKPSQ